MKIFRYYTFKNKPPTNFIKWTNAEYVNFWNTLIKLLATVLDYWLVDMGKNATNISLLGRSLPKKLIMSIDFYILKKLNKSHSDY